MTMDFNSTQMGNGQSKKLLTLVWFQECKWASTFFDQHQRRTACVGSTGETVSLLVVCHFEENLTQLLLLP